MKNESLAKSLKTTGMIAGAAVVPCLSVSEANAAIHASTPDFYISSSWGMWLAVFDSKAMMGITNVSDAAVIKVSGGLNFSTGTATFAGVGSYLTQGRALAKGELIDDDMVFTGDMLKNASEIGDSSVYLGVQFVNEGNTLYGWTQFEGVVFEDGKVKGTIVAWGYEDQPGVGIRAGQTEVPEPTSLALLACGAGGLAARRRKRRSA